LIFRGTPVPPVLPKSLSVNFLIWVASEPEFQWEYL
jgi:hypothetical protein